MPRYGLSDAQINNLLAQTDGAEHRINNPGGQILACWNWAIAGLAGLQINNPDVAYDIIAGRSDNPDANSIWHAPAVLDTLRLYRDALTAQFALVDHHQGVGLEVPANVNRATWDPAFTTVTEVVMDAVANAHGLAATDQATGLRFCCHVERVPAPQTDPVTIYMPNYTHWWLEMDFPTAGGVVTITTYTFPNQTYVTAVRALYAYPAQDTIRRNITTLNPAQVALLGTGAA
jgi:hypothetical protein